jgi:hypothetical protein
MKFIIALLGQEVKRYVGISLIILCNLLILLVKIGKITVIFNSGTMFSVRKNVILVGLPSSLFQRRGRRLPAVIMASSADGCARRC